MSDETRKDVGQLTKRIREKQKNVDPKVILDGLGTGESYGVLCNGLEPLPQPGETMEKRARGHAEQITWELGRHIKAETGLVLSQATVTFFIDKIAAELRLIEQETAQKWISVKERLPEHKQSVLVFREHIAPQMQQAKYFQQHSKGAGFYCGSLVDHVTHWMPLPFRAEFGLKEE